MKNKLRRITAMILALLMCSFIFAACNSANDNAKHLKLTEQMIKNKITESDGKGTLTIDSGSAENVTAFTYVFENENTSSLKNKDYTKNVVTKARSGKSLTLFDTPIFLAFCETMWVTGLIYEKENFNGEAYIEELLSILCDGSTKTYNGWTISATINETSKKVTIKCHT